VGVGPCGGCQRLGAKLPLRRTFTTSQHPWGHPPVESIVVPLDVSELVVLSLMCVSERAANGVGLRRLVCWYVGGVLRLMRTINRGFERAALSGSACWATVGELCLMVVGAGWVGE